VVRSSATRKVLQAMTNTNSQLSMIFSYGSNNSGELTQVTFPYGGNLPWAYGNATFTGRTYPINRWPNFNSREIDSMVTGTIASCPEVDIVIS
jgi:hypothetical protein